MKNSSKIRKLEQRASTILQKNVFIEKYYFIKKLVILRKCRRDYYWYSNYVGHILEVREFKDLDDFKMKVNCGAMPEEVRKMEFENNFFLFQSGYIKLIRKMDCDVLK